jgi:hypothetical protein
LGFPDAGTDAGAHLVGVPRPLGVLVHQLHAPITAAVSSPKQIQIHPIKKNTQQQADNVRTWSVVEMEIR